MWTRLCIASTTDDKAQSPAEGIPWAMVTFISLGFGVVLCLIPILLRGAPQGAWPPLGIVLGTLLPAVVLPSLCVGVVIAPLLQYRPLWVAVVLGISWPFVALLAGINLSQDILGQSIAVYSLFGFSLKFCMFAIPLGAIVSIIVYRVVNKSLSLADFWQMPQSLNAISGFQYRLRPWVACLLSVFPGLGQLYNGEPLKASLFYITWQLGLTWISRFFVLNAPLNAPYNVVGAGMLVLSISFISIAEAFFSARDNRNRSHRAYRSWLVFVAILFLCSYTIRPLAFISADRYYASFYHILSPAMMPTLIKGDQFIVDRTAYLINHPQRGDIIQFNGPDQGTYFRRVVGMPGETVSIRGHRVFIDGRPIDELSYARYSGLLQHADHGPVKVGLATYFVLADNRIEDSDSRQFGPISSEQIVGKVSVIYWSLDKEASMLRWDRIGRKIISPDFGASIGSV